MGAARIEIGVLGPLAVWVDDRAVEVGGRRQRALLARLALADGAVVSTGRLLADLWPGAPGRPPGALQEAVSHLRRVLEPDRPPRAPARVLVSTAPGYALALDGAHARTDASRFTALLADAGDGEQGEHDLQAALRCWRGPAYAEVADEPWAAAEAGRLDELRLLARERLAAVQLGRGRPQDAVADLESHVAEHPLREEGVRLLALARYRSGRAPEALEALRTLRHALGTDLGLEPGPAIAALESAILRHDLVVVGHRVTAPADPGAPVLGRSAEIARLDAAAHRVTAPGGAGELVVLLGEAGMGKSALLDGWSTGLAARGWTRARGRCPEVEGAPPAWAWSEVATELGDTAITGTPFARGRALAAALRRSAAHAPVVVTLDDLHRGDDETLRLLRVVVGAAVPGVLVVATVRAEDLGAVAATFAALAAHVGDRVELGGLDADAAAALCARHGLPLEPGRAAAARDRTGGNPLFLREIARLVAADGVRDAVPAGVRDVLRRRLAGLPAAARTVLAHAALFGREVDLTTLVAFEARAPDAGDPATVEDRVVDALEAAETAGVAVTGDDGRIAFAHDLWREVLEADVPRLRRARLHARALDALDAGGPLDAGVPHDVAGSAAAPVAARARHVLAAGDRVDADRALAVLEVAASQAAARGAYRRAAELWSAAVAAARRASLPPVRVLALRCAVVSAQFHAGAARPAHDERRAVADEARALGDLDLLALAVGSHDAPVTWPSKEDAGHLLDAADELLAAEGAGRWRPEGPTLVRVLLGAAFGAEDTEPERAADLARRALAGARALGDARLECGALNAALLASFVPERWADVAGHARALLTAAGAAGRGEYEVVGHYGLFVAANLNADLDAADRHAAAAVALADGGALETTLAWTRIFEGGRLVVRGEIDEADRRYGDQVEELRAARVSDARAFAALHAFTIGHVRGDTSPSLGSVREASPYYGHRMADVHARACLDAGLHAEARRVWRPDVPVDRDLQWVAWTTVRAEVAAALGDTEVGARCEEQLAPFTGRLSLAGHGSLALAPVDLALARLCRLLGRDEDRRRHHLDEAARVAGSGHPWQALIDAER